MNNRPFTLVGGQVLTNTHNKIKCMNEYCTLHNFSDHHMIDWPQNWRPDRKIMERICPHGIGHPDPDDITDDKTHGCDGCCALPELSKRRQTMINWSTHALDALIESGRLSKDSVTAYQAIVGERQLQALLDENKRLTVDRDFWRQTAVDMEQSIQNCISDNDKLGYMLNGAIRNFNDAVDARGVDICGGNLEAKQGDKQ